ncbi:MAG TPA: ABC transporter permease [Dehalococcoidia bacterium]|nr:ABC transporter permease [Dehalococcoidia bacterium]
MQTYIARRILACVPVVLLISIFTFGILRLIPGDVLVAQLGGAQGMSAADMAGLRHQLGFDRPLPVQYLDWIGSGLRGNWGQSYWLHKPVTQALAQAFPVSAELGLMAFVITIVVAVPLGIVSAIRQDTWVDHVARLFSISFLSIPSFFTAILTITFLSRWFHWIPPRGYIDFFSHPTLNLEQMILPALVLGLSTSAGTARLTRTTVLEVMREDYVRTARAKGLTEDGVIWRHVLRNAMPPVVVYWGVSLSALVTGAVLIEVVYGLSGMGRLLVDAIGQRDWPVVQTGVLFIVVLTLLLNLAIDLLQGVMDPRIKVT